MSFVSSNAPRLTGKRLAITLAMRSISGTRRLPAGRSAPATVRPTFGVRAARIEAVR